ncbi:MAG: acyl-CoA dehydrogenase [Bacteriovoracaceae bacterium]|nr:acyl-CoA dehydrogenase [Bacteriovoracaceae bacterium]
MPKYKADHRDIFFNLFEMLKVQDFKDYGLNESDLKSMLLEYDKFVENEIFPTREPSDAQGVKLVNGKVIVPECLHRANKAFYENGWFALGLPAEWEGAEVPEAFFNACISLMTGANVGYSMYPGLTRAALSVLLLKANDEQKKILIPAIMSGKWGGTMCLTEPGAGSDVGAARTQAKKLPNGKYKITGTKIFISSGESDLYENNIHLVLAKTPGAAEGTKGLSLFIVPRFKYNADGSMAGSNDVICKKIEHKMGIHASATCELMFGEAGNCEGELLGEEFEGMTNMFIMMNEARLLCAVQGESQANLVYGMSEKYARERVQFGTEIVNIPDVKRMLLKMRAAARGMRSLCAYTANLFDLKKADHSIEKEIGFFTPLCKSYCTELAFQVSVDAVQVHGGYGYCTEYGIEQFVRDIKIATIYEGTNGIQAFDFLTRKVLKDNGELLKNILGKIAGSVKAAPAEFKQEQQMMLQVLNDSEKILNKLAGYAAKKEMNKLLQHATEFLNYFASLAMAWRLLESAKLSQSMLDKNPTNEDKTFYQSKVVDFKVYCAHYLVHNLALSKSMTDFELDLTTLAL